MSHDAVVSDREYTGERMRRILKLLHIRTNILWPNWSRRVMKEREDRSFLVSLMKRSRLDHLPRTSINSTKHQTYDWQLLMKRPRMTSWAFPSSPSLFLSHFFTLSFVVPLKSQLIIASDSCPYNNCISLSLCTTYGQRIALFLLIDSIILYKYVAVYFVTIFYRQ